MAVGLAGMTIAFVAFGVPHRPWVVVGCLTVVLGEILFVPSFDLWISRRVPEHRLAKAMGAMHFFRSAGNMAPWPRASCSTCRAPSAWRAATGTSPPCWRRAAHWSA
ncbi:hypothetical protein ACFQ3Z_24735 [Streptomyces nogalater]